jgi:small subunit ribosomal protein S2
MTDKSATKSSSSSLSLRGLLEAGAHFGHQSRRWHPRMRQFLYGARGGVHIFDLVKTKECLEDSAKAAQNITASGGLIIFVGTKRQAQGITKEAALRCGMPHVTERWMGGFLTNYNQLKKSLNKLKDLKTKRDEGKFSHRTKKERLLIDREVNKLEKFFGGLTQVEELPKALFVVDTHNEATAVREANLLGITVIGLVDSNANPDLVNHVIPANDDAVKSIQMVVHYITDAIIKGKQKADKKKIKEQDKVEEQSKEGQEETSK